ncbi:2-dehydro-3-deoxygalactonokinase [Shimia haliotis]|uniref:2-keto-3-deoxygalactonate kinase n=1 Tax=Shimia haliotis TaxID=1280847 RepID=A0A1I4CXW9_9RHOB|nr:2-dehydro-3-deoxygalactonokinase [Shimia haliotis]SFK85623.1 2-keto-3-deoxygalactonate kinase [Shimia haliotis]
MAIRAEWIAVDWGTSNLRAFAMRGETVLAEATSDHGMSRLEKPEFGPALMALIGDWLGEGVTDVVACGMVGARQGWAEAPYSAVPSAPLAGNAVLVGGTDARVRVFIVPGLKQEKPADVMRGEETQVAGFLAKNPNWDGVICLPGTHTKWVHVSADEVVSFRTFMTGEMFALLSKASVLQHSVGEGWDEAAFEDGLSTTLSRPESIGAELFGIRANDLLNATPAAAGRARLSGLLLGAELAAARPYWLGQNIAVIGDAKLSEIYAKALKTQGGFVSVANCQEMTIAGLAAARNLLG